MLHNNYEVRVLVKNRPINEYPHNGQTFIEGRDGSNFEIEFKNLSPNRVEAVLSVDGLSIIDGKEAGPQSSGYLVDAYGTIRIPGWKLTNDQVAAFQFAGKKKSYAQQSTGSSRNTGVIGALVFSEKNAAVYRRVNNAAFPLSGEHLTSGAYGVNTAWQGSTDMSYSAVGQMTTSSSVGQSALRSVNSVVLNNTSKGSRSRSSAEPVAQSLGTAFGKAQDFATTEVSFTRGDLSAMIILYYDDSRGLRARGIELARPANRRVPYNDTPQAFPGMQKGCVPPSNWEG